MKIAVPTDEKRPDSGVCPSFGRTPYFLFYDTQTKEYSFHDNSAAASQGGAGIKAAQSLADGGVRVVLTPRCGDNAVKVLNETGIEIYKTVSGTAKDNIDAFGEGKLRRLNESHPGFHGHER